MNLKVITSRRMLIIAKTYPELSSKYGETVCTAAVDEPGNPLRLYPIPFRYLSGPQRFKRYQWISATVSKSQRDTRPESRTVLADSIVLEECVPPTSDEWGKRAEQVLKADAWQYSSMKSLLENQRKHGQSLAFFRPSEIKAVTARKRAKEDAQSFEQKLKSLRDQNTAMRRQFDLFESTMPAKMKIWSSCKNECVSSGSAAMMIAKVTRCRYSIGKSAN